MASSALTIEQAIERMRRHILARDRQYMVRLVQAYKDAWDSLQPEWDVLEAGLESGKDKAWLLARLKALQGQIEARFYRYSIWMEQEQQAAIREALEAARSDTRRIVETFYGSLPPNVIRTIWHEVPEDALITMLGMTGPDSPLYDRMVKKLGPAMADRVGTGLRRGIALGYHPRKLQSILLQELGAGLQWSLTSTRTAMMQAYWRTTSNIYKRNDVVKGWYWLAALDDRTCFLCAMQSGTFHPKTETLNGHYACRCTMVPAVKSFRELGINLAGPPKPNVPNGRKWFEGLPEARQKKMMGLTKWQMWKDGKIDLTSILTTKHDEVYGDMLAAKTIGQLIGAEPVEAGGPGVVEPWMDALRREEAAIYNEPIEHAAMISQDGTEVFRAVGDERSVTVRLTEQEQRLLGEMPISTHNHPGKVGTPLSSQDIRFAIHWNVSRERAVSIDRLAEAMPGPDGWPTLGEWDKAFRDAEHKWWAFFHREYLHGTVRPPEWWEAWHDRGLVYNAIMVEACRKVGIIYRFVRWAPEV